MFYPEIKGYEVEKELKNLYYSSSTEVYKGIRKEDNLPVAIRKYSRNSDSDNYGSFQNQVKILSRLNHPQIPKYIDSISKELDFFLIEEYIDGKTISYERNFQKIKSIANQLLSIVIYLQEQNEPIVHLNINPENVLIDTFGRIYLIDFSLARNLNCSVTPSQLGKIVSNNFNCVAPELLIANKATYSSELYSIGLTIIALLDYAKRLDLCQKFNENYEIDFSRLVLDLETDKSTQLKFVTWLKKMVAITPTKRFRNAEDARISLQEIEEEEDRSKENVAFGQSFKLEDFEKSFEMPTDREGSTKKTEKHLSMSRPGRDSILGVFTGFLALIGLAAFLPLFSQIEFEETSNPNAIKYLLNNEDK